MASNMLTFICMEKLRPKYALSEAPSGSYCFSHILTHTHAQAKLLNCNQILGHAVDHYYTAITRVFSQQFVSEFIDFDPWIPSVEGQCPNYTMELSAIAGIIKLTLVKASLLL